MVKVAETVKQPTIEKTETPELRDTLKEQNKEKLSYKPKEEVKSKKKQVEKKETLDEALDNFKSQIDNSAVKNQGFTLSHLISDEANIKDAKQRVLESVPVVGDLFKAKRIAKDTAINTMTNMGTGAIKTLEGAADTVSDLVVNPWEQRINYAADYLTKGKKVADENLKDLKKMQQRDIKKNMTQDIQDKTGYSDVVDDLEKNSLVKRENLGGQVAQGVGGMVPALVLGQAFGGTPELTNTAGLTGKEKAAAILGNVGKTYVSQMPSNAVLGASSYGSGTEEALNEGATMDQARKYGLLNAAIEQGTEMMTGGIPGLGGKGGLDSAIEPIINKNTNGYVNALLKAGQGAFGEGLEEYTGAMLDPLAKKVYSDEKINWDEVRKNARKAGITGAITGALLNSPQTTQDIQDVKTEKKIRNVIGDSQYAEGNQQYNPEYKGWEKQRQQNAVEEQQRQEESANRREEVQRVAQERAQKQAQEQQNQQTNTITPERVETPQNNVKNADLNNDIKSFEDVKQDYKYYKNADLENFDTSMLDKAKETIQANKQGKRTKQEWLDIAQNIGQQAENLDSEQLKKLAFESFAYEKPNGKDNLNRQGNKYVGFGIHEWVKAVYDGAGVGKPINTLENQLERQGTRILQDAENQRNGMIDNFKSYLEENNITNPTQKDIDNSLVDILGYDNEQTSMENSKTDKLYNQYAREYMKENGIPFKENIPAEMEKEPVIKVETTGEKGKQYWKEQGANEETAKVLSEMPKPEKKSVREKIKEGIASAREEYSYLKRNLVDKGETIYKLSKDSKNPLLYAKYDKMGTTPGEANYDIGKAQTNLEGKKYKNFTDANGKKTSMSLNQIWEGVDPEVANEYLAHYLNVDRYNQLNEDGTRKYVFGENVTDQDSLKKIAELEQEHPELKRFGENVWQYGKNQLQDRVKAGQISQAQANQFMEETPHYVRLQRNVDTKPSNNLEFDNQGRAKVNKNLKEFKGSTLDILPFKDAMAQYTLDVRNSIRTNLFAQELAKTTGLSSTGEKINSIDDLFETDQELLKDNGDGTYSLTFFNNGTATTIPINQGIYEALEPNKHYKYEDTLPFKGIRKFDSIRKALLTDKNPMFLATNMMKDAFDAPLNSKYPAQFVKNYPRALKEIMSNGEYYQQYQALGGLQNTYFDHEGFQKEGSKYNPMTWIEKGNNAIEQIPRLAEFISTMEKTGDIDQAMYNAAEITTNFKRGGNWSKSANRNGATFLNASIQGFSKQVRNFTDIQNPRQATQMLGKILALGIAPGLLNDLMWDDDDEYKEMQDYQKDRYYLFKGKDGNWIRIPKGRAVSIFQSAARRTKYALGGDKNAFKDFGKFATDQVAPNNPFENNIISPFVDVARNKSWSGNDIVSESIANKSHPEEEYTIKTDELSKWIGKKTGKSPAKINYLIDQYSGAIGDLVLPNITKKATSRSDNLASNIFLNPVKDKFTTNAITSSKNQGEFYDALSNAEDNKKWSKSTPEDQAIYKYLYNKNKEISDIRKQSVAVQEQDISNKEKYDKVMEYQKQINEISKKAVDESKNVKKPSKNEFVIGNKHYTVDSDGKVNAIKQETTDKAKEYGLSVGDYVDVTSHYGSIKADKDSNGNTIAGSKKQKFIDYVNEKDELTKQQKIAIIRKYYKKYEGE